MREHLMRGTAVDFVDDVLAGDAPVRPSAASGPTTTGSHPALDRFRSRVPDLWPQLAPHCHTNAPVDELRAVVRSLSERPLGQRRNVVLDLEAMLPGWAHFDQDQRAVLTGAVLFLAESADTCDEHTQSQVVTATVSTLLRRHG